MSGGKGGGNSTTVQKADPWIGQQDFLKFGFNQAKDVYNSGGAKYYPGQNWNPYSQTTQGAIGSAINRGTNGSAAEQGLNSYLGQSLGGNFLNSNPYLDAMYGNAAKNMTNAFSEGVMPGLNATFGLNGMANSSAHGLAAGRASGELGDSLAGLAANIYGGNYANERNLMQQAAGMVPMASALDYQNIAKVAQAGGMQDQKANEILQANMDRWNYNQNLPQQNLQNYIAAIQGNYGGASTTNTNNGGGGGLGGALGGGLLGYGLGSALPSIGSSMGLMLGSGAWPLALGGAAAGALGWL